MKELLVSGTDGFIGGNYVKELSSYKKLVASDFSDIETLKSKVKGTPVVVHLGALIQGTDEEQMEANAGGTELLLKAMVESREQRKIIIASTFAVYGVQDKKLTEDSAVAPRNGYGKSKAEVERLVEEYVKKFGISAVILRFSNVYGLGMPPNKHSVVANFINAAINDEALKINGDGNQERDFIYVGDVVDALNKAVDLNIEPGEFVILNISSNERVSLNHLIDQIGKVVGKKLKVDYPNPQMLDAGVWIGDNTKASELLGWKPEVSLEEGLRRTYEASKK